MARPVDVLTIAIWASDAAAAAAAAVFRHRSSAVDIPPAPVDCYRLLQYCIFIFIHQTGSKTNNYNAFKERKQRKLNYTYYKLLHYILSQIQQCRLDWLIDI